MKNEDAYCKKFSQCLWIWGKSFQCLLVCCYVAVLTNDHIFCVKWTHLLTLFSGLLSLMRLFTYGIYVAIKTLLNTFEQSKLLSVWLLKWDEFEASFSNLPHVINSVPQSLNDVFSRTLNLTKIASKFIHLTSAS